VDDCGVRVSNVRMCKKMLYGISGAESTRSCLVHMLIGDLEFVFHALEVPSCPVNIISHEAIEAALDTPCQLNYITTDTQLVLRITRSDGWSIVLPKSTDGFVRIVACPKGELCPYVDGVAGAAAHVCGGGAAASADDWVWDTISCKWFWDSVTDTRPISTVQNAHHVEPGTNETGEEYITRVIATRGPVAGLQTAPSAAGAPSPQAVGQQAAQRAAVPDSPRPAGQPVLAAATQPAETPARGTHAAAGTPRAAAAGHVAAAATPSRAPAAGQAAVHQIPPEVGRRMRGLEAGSGPRSPARETPAASDEGSDEEGSGESSSMVVSVPSDDPCADPYFVRGRPAVTPSKGCKGKGGAGKATQCGTCAGCVWRATHRGQRCGQCWWCVNRSTNRACRHAMCHVTNKKAAREKHVG
jgi:hypothetical protein